MLLDCFTKTLTGAVKLLVLHRFAEDSQIWSTDLDSLHTVLMEQLTSQLCNQNNNLEFRMYKKSIERPVLSIWIKENQDNREPDLGI